MKTTVSVYGISRSYDYKREGKTRTYTFRIWEESKISAVSKGIDGNDIPEVCESLKAEGT